LAESTATGKTHLQVQKLFARHCLECHDGTHAAATVFNRTLADSGNGSILWNREFPGPDD
ncbi:MAG: hypothetical protein GY758_31335, partial [Fuerstiella sp.]|nr:hypothetical protein [Fuerstiella sp.]